MTTRGEPVHFAAIAWPLIAALQPRRTEPPMTTTDRVIADPSLPDGTTVFRPDGIATIGNPDPRQTRIAATLCSRREDWHHHDRTDDYPCTGCRDDAQAVLDTLAAEDGQP